MKIAVFLVLAIHGLGLMALLMQGCKKEPDAGTAAAPESTNAAPAFVEPTNAPAAQTNLVAAPTNVAPVESPAAAPPQSNPTDYVIVKGDTFSTLATKFHVSVKALLDANPSVEPTKLKIGQTIHIPAAPATTAANTSNGSATPTNDGSSRQTYTVKSGDSLTKIATQFGTTVKALRSENNLKTDKIVVGQKLRIPSKASAAPASSAPASATPGPTTTSSGQ